MPAVSPVPPLATANVPANVTAPEVAELGVKPVEPAENVLTPSVALVATLKKSEPFQATTAFSSAAKTTPEVGVAPRIVTV